MALPKWLTDMTTADYIKIAALTVPFIISIPVVNHAIAQVVTETVGERIGTLEEQAAQGILNDEEIRQQLEQLQTGQQYNDGMQAEQLEAILQLLICQDDPANRVCQ